MIKEIEPRLNVPRAPHAVIRKHQQPVRGCFLVRKGVAPAEG